MQIQKYDYSSVLERLKARVLAKLNGENLLLTSTNAAILETVAEEFDDIAMYDEYLTRECVWATAKGMSSIKKQVDYFNYFPHRKIGASGSIRFSVSKNFDSGYATNIVIPKWTQVSGGGLTFLTKENAFFKAGAPFIDVPVVQGELKIFDTLISPVTFPKTCAYAQVTILDPDIENTLYEVRVNGATWKGISNIRLAVQEEDPGSANVYALQTLPNYEGVTIYFGNNMLGRSLNYSDRVEFIYLQTKGSKGNILSTGIVTNVDSKIADDTGKSITLYCSNMSALFGGADYEDIADIKAYAPRSFQTGNRAISSKDYETLILNTGILKDVQVWGEKEINEDRKNPPGTYVELLENVIYIAGYSVDVETLRAISITLGEQNIIRKHLNDKKGTTDILQFVDTQIIYVTFKPIVFVRDTYYTFEQTKNFVYAALKENYSILRKAEDGNLYRKSLYLSDYLSVINSAESVDHCTCTLSLSQMLSFTNAFVFNINLNLNNIQRGSIRIMIKNDNPEKPMPWRELAYDDGVTGKLKGSKIDPSSDDIFNINDVDIDYQYGSIGDVIILSNVLDDDHTNYQLRIDFELDESLEKGDLNLLLRNQLFAWCGADINVYLMGQESK